VLGALRQPALRAEIRLDPRTANCGLSLLGRAAAQVDPARCNFLSNGRRKSESGTRPVASYPSNGFGLFDMVGNVWEWVADWYAPDYYAKGSNRDPQGPADGVMRISPAMFAALFEGLDWRLVRPEEARRPQVAG